MTRTTFSLIATLMFVLLFGGQSATRAQSVGANCVIGSGSSAAVVRTNGWISNGKPNGYVYYALGGGINFSGNYNGLSFSTLSNGNMQAVGTAYGYVMAGAVRLATVQLTATYVYNPVTHAGTIDLHSAGAFGSIYLWDSGTLAVSSGSFVITH